jgi:hypothetical protein
VRLSRIAHNYDVVADLRRHRYRAEQERNAIELNKRFVAPHSRASSTCEHDGAQTFDH